MNLSQLSNDVDAGVDVVLKGEWQLLKSPFACRIDATINLRTSSTIKAQSPRTRQGLAEVGNFLSSAASPSSYARADA